MSRLQERIENFSRAFDLYDLAHSAFKSDESNDINKLAVIQAFEVTYELGWKILKDYLSDKGISAYTPKDVIKSAFSANILPTAQIWIDMSNDRNFSSHEYNSDKVDILLEKIAGSYYSEMKRFYDNLESFNA